VGLIDKYHQRDAFSSFAEDTISKIQALEAPLIQRLVTSLDTSNHLEWSLQLPFLNPETAVVGNTLLIKGTDVEVNAVLESVFYLAPTNTRGAVNLSVSVTDTPLGCRDLHIPISWTPSELSSNISSTSHVDVNLCDEGISNTVTSILPIFVIAVNRPPPSPNKRVYLQCISWSNHPPYRIICNRSGLCRY